MILTRRGFRSSSAYTGSTEMPAGWLAGAAVLGTAVNAYDANKAAGAQQNAGNAANTTQWNMYQQTRADQAPWRASGGNALSALDAYYGLPGGNAGGGADAGPQGPSGTYGGGPIGGGPGYVQTTGTGAGGGPGGMVGGPRLTAGQGMPAASGGAGGPSAGPGAPASGVDYNKLISSLPGYQFQFQQGQDAVSRSLAARGLFDSGAGAKALTQYGQGYAATASQDYLNGLRNLAGLGQVSTQATGAAGTNAANQIGGNMIYGGNAAASGYANVGNAINSGIGNLAGIYGYQNANPYPGGGPGWSQGQYWQPNDPLTASTGSGVNPWTGGP
jgi:hypothetical protein